MRIPDHPTLIRRMLDARLKKLAAATPILAASLSSYTHRCGRPAGRCHHRGTLHTGQHLTFKEDGKTRSVYVPKDLLPEVRSWVAQQQRLQLLLQEIHLLDWLDELPDTRDQEACVYATRFLAWGGLWLYLGQLGSRRQRDFQFDAWGTHVLANLNRLAGTDQSTRPVHDTLDHFLGHSTPAGFASLRTKLVRRLCRRRVLDPARLLGYLVLVLDGTGLWCWHRRHCPHCLTQQHEKTTLYLHNVLEAQILGPAGVVLSVGREFIDNTAEAQR
jgi:hypothetical protein